MDKDWKVKYIINDGEFLYNKKWNGKGYDEDGNIIYELIDGNGKVKEYYDWNGKLMFEGEYLDGRRNGKGKEYDCYGDIIYEGEYLKGKKNGIGKEFFNGILIFKGQYINGIKNGFGKEYTSIIYSTYNSDLLNEKKFFEVKKTYYHIKLIFEGEYVNGKKNGNGKEYDYFGLLIHEGKYLNGERIS